MTDSEELTRLLAACGRGDEAALKSLYQATSSRLFAVALRILRRRDWAEEVLQECFVKFWQHAADFTASRSQPMTWMTRIVRNRCIDWLRRPDVEVPDPDGDIIEAWADDAPGPLARLLETESGRQLAECMKGLADNQRVAVALAFFDELSHTEVAAKLAAPLGTVKSWVRRGLDSLKRCMG